MPFVFGKPGPEFIAPPPYRFVARYDATLKQQLFDIAKTQREVELPAHG